MKIALIRHGAVIGNLYGAYVGAQDQPLCAEGRERLMHNKRAGGYPVVDGVFCSPMLRCQQTARLLYTKHTPVPVHALRERDFGEFEGLNHKEITARPGFGDWGRTPESMVFPGGESWQDFRARCLEGFSQVTGEMEQRQLERAAVVCHGGTVMAVMQALLEPAGSYHIWQCPTGSGYQIEYDPVERTAGLRRRICL